MLKNVCCAICLSINKSTINIYNTDLLYVYETLANFKVADVECWLCYICHTRLQQCHQLQQLAVQTRGLIDDIFHNKIDIKFGAFGSLLELSTTNTMITDTTYYETPAPEVPTQFCDDRGANPDPNNVTTGSLPHTATISRDPLLDTVSDTSHDVQSKILLEVKIENNQNDDEYPLPTSSQFIGSQENTVQGTVSAETIQHIRREIVIKKLEAEFEGNEVEQKTNIKSEYAPTEKLEITFEEVTQGEIDEHDQYPTTSLEHAKIKQERAENIRDEGVDQIKQDTDKKQDACEAEAKKPHKCDVCSKRFPTKSLLVTHSRTHTGEKSGCDVCYENFLRKVYLKRHMLSHSEDKPHFCDICSKQYKRILDLQRHLLTHSDHKGFNCELCSKKFTKRRYLESHSFVHTGIRNYTCDVCSMKFSTKSGLNIHKHSHGLQTSQL